MNIDNPAFFKISYGLYLITTFDGAKHNGMIANTAIQVTSNPARVSVTINKDTFSHSVIASSGKLNVCCLDINTPFSVFEHFGFQSGKTIDKFSNQAFDISSNGLAVLKDNVNAYISLDVINSVDLGTHTMFICDVIESKTISNTPSITYDYYQNNVKPKKQASSTGYVCKICGYVHDSDTLPEDFICPICKHGAEVFEKIDSTKPEPPKDSNTTKYKCLVCGAEFELKEGDKVECPICGVGEEYLEKLN